MSDYSPPARLRNGVERMRLPVAKDGHWRWLAVPADPRARPNRPLLAARQREVHFQLRHLFDAQVVVRENADMVASPQGMTDLLSAIIRSHELGFTAAPC